jgi:high affinity Mn2+ porin
MKCRILFTRHKHNRVRMLPPFMSRSTLTLLTLSALVSLVSIIPPAASAQDVPYPSTTVPQPSPAPDAPSTEPSAPTIFPHSNTSWYFIAGQANIVFQAHAPFHSPYQGPNSLLSRGEYKTSLVGTLYLGAELLRNPQHHLEAIYDEESAGGRGISEALGLAGFTNLDVVRNPNLGPIPYMARAELHQTIGLSPTLIHADRGPFSLATQVPERRIDLRVGKLGLPDIFDLNNVGTDSHLQFLNWTTDNNGAWDYAADTRGYTNAAIAEYNDKDFSARYALALMPTVANGIDLDWNLGRASGQNMEVEWRHNLLGPIVNPDRKGVIRILSYVNHAHMGLYRDANKAFLAGDSGSAPVITSVEKYGEVKYGFGLNAEQELTDSLRIFGRFGWNEGQHESFAYTEVDQTFEFGGDYSLRSLHRENDKLGLAFVTNAIKRDHQEYLKLGGLGFLLGDGNLNYAREDILETYYNLHTWRGLYYALDAQYINHPGYNQSRGPVLVESLRMHIDF